MPYLFNHRPRIQRAGAWTETEDHVLRATYPTTSAYAVGKRLGRSENAVWLRARALGLDKRPEVHHPWTEDELALLTQHYSTEPAATLAKRLGRTATAVNQQARCLGLMSGKTVISQSANVDYFRRVSTPEKAYILGLLAADGNVSDVGRISFGLQEKDAELLRFVHSRLAPSHAVHTSSTRGFLSFSFTSHEMSTDLARWGIVPRKSRTLEWPAGLGRFQRPFLLGYFDGDGSACIAHAGDRSYPSWSVCSGSLQFLVDLKDYVRESAGVELDKIHHRAGASLYQVATTGSGAYALDRWLHQDGFGLARKRYPREVIERDEGPVTPGRTRNGVASRWYTAEFKASAVEALRQAREVNGVVYGDVTRVATQLGVDRDNLRRWAIKDGLT